MGHADPIPIKPWGAGAMDVRRKAGGNKRRGEGREGGGGELHAHQADGQKRDNKRMKATPPC